MGSGTELQQSDGWNLERLELCAFAHGRKDRKCGEKAAAERGESTGRAYKFGWVGINFQIVLSEKRHIESFN